MSLKISGASFFKTLSIVRKRGFVIGSFDHDNKSSCVKRLPNNPRLCVLKFNISLNKISDSISTIAAGALVGEDECH
jgi:hypothetical protein